MRHPLLSTLIVFGLAVGVQAAVAQTFTVGFENLPEPPALDGAGQLRYANGASDLYEGIVWDPSISVTGSQYRTSGDLSNPLHGLVHAGNFYVTNEGSSGGNGSDGVLITTSNVLLGAWFGRTAYFGFSSGADQITIHALSSSEASRSVVFALPAPAQAGQPGVMAFVDTSAFATMAGITGYRIDRRLSPGDTQGGWAADDFVFTTAVPEPGQALLLLAGLGLVAAVRRRSLSAAA